MKAQGSARDGNFTGHWKPMRCRISSNGLCTAPMAFHGKSQPEASAWGSLKNEHEVGIWYLFPQPESCSGLCKAKTMSVECLENIGSLIFTKHVSNRRFLSISSWTWFLRLSPKGQSNAASLPFCTCSRTSEFQDTNCGSFWAVRLWDNFCSSF